jgi:hypothetical protein
VRAPPQVSGPSRADREQAWLTRGRGRAPLRDINNQKLISGGSDPPLKLSFILKHMMYGDTKGRNGLVSRLVAMAYIGSALVAPCLAKESQVPLNSNAVSKLQWEECGEVNNHTLQCNHLHFFSILNWVDKKWKVPNSMFRWIISTNRQTRRSRYLSSEC